MKTAKFLLTLCFFLATFLVGGIALVDDFDVFGAVTSDSGPEAPTLAVTTSGTTVSLSWTSVTGATGYILYYAPHPYTGPESIQTIHMGTQTTMSANLWGGAAFYVAVKAYDSDGNSGYSNIELFILGSDALVYPIVDTNQVLCYDDSDAISCPNSGEALYGQDAQSTGNAPSYADNGDGTVTDNITGLMWQQSPDTDGNGDIDADDKLNYDQAVAGAGTLSLGGYTDWRLPTIKELYSLIEFSGIECSSYEGTDTSDLVPFIDTAYFDFGYGDTSAGERIIDAQYASITKYVSTTMNGNETMFGVNFADGRIKGYGTSMTFFVIYVRGNTSYGGNSFIDNGDGTITDSASGLMWSQNDSGTGLNWEEALAW